MLETKISFRVLLNHVLVLSHSSLSNKLKSRVKTCVCVGLQTISTTQQVTEETKWSGLSFTYG